VEDLSAVNRPVSLQELAIVLGVPAVHLERLARAHDIDPACRIGRTRVYGPRQIRRFYAALEGVAPA
jgi:hypothetical protein